jgi:AcrR family transcriptional regulator
MLLSRPGILSAGINLAKTVPLQDISIVRLAKELGITPALIHYYMGGRDALTSGIINLFYQELIGQLPEPTGDWRPDIEALAEAVYRSFLKYPGVSAYVVGHNRFRLVQILPDSEKNYAILYFERFVSTMRTAGFDAAGTALYSHLLSEFIMSQSFITVRHMWPGEHGVFLGALFEQLDPETFPGVHYIRRSFLRVTGTGAFKAGLQLVLNSLDEKRPKASAAPVVNGSEPPPPPPKRPAPKPAAKREDATKAVPPRAPSAKRKRTPRISESGESA